MHSKTKIQEKLTLESIRCVSHTIYTLETFEIKFDPFGFPIVCIVFEIILMSSIEKCQCSLIAIINSNEPNAWQLGWVSEPHTHITQNRRVFIETKRQNDKIVWVCMNNPWINVANSSFHLTSFFRGVFRVPFDLLGV